MLFLNESLNHGFIAVVSHLFCETHQQSMMDSIDHLTRNKEEEKDICIWVENVCFTNPPYTA